MEARGGKWEKGSGRGVRGWGEWEWGVGKWGGGGRGMIGSGGEMVKSVSKTLAFSEYVNMFCITDVEEIERKKEHNCAEKRTPR